MEHKLIKTENYLLIVSNEIEVGDYITDKYNVWVWQDDSSLLGRKKVIAHLPLNNAPYLEGVDVLPKIGNEIPIAFEREFKENKLWGQKGTGIYITKKNSQGRTEWVGTYKY